VHGRVSGVCGHAQIKMTDVQYNELQYNRTVDSAVYRHNTRLVNIATVA